MLLVWGSLEYFAFRHLFNNYFVTPMKFGTGMLELLGWDVSMSATKRFLFEHCFVSLGVQISFGKTLSDAITVSNKPGRIESLKRAIDNVKAVGTLGFREALSIKGKVAYAEGQLFGRVAAPLCRFLSTWSSKGIDRQVTPELLMLLDSSLEALSSARPRVVSCHEASKPVIVFIDGACEPEGTSIGAVLFCPGLQPEAFGAVLDDQTVSSWKSTVDQTQVIGQAEICHMVVARYTWAKHLRNRRVIYFIDNDSARLACIKSYSPVISSLNLIMQGLLWDSKYESSAWFGRVPTASNPADDPSRMDSSLVKEIFGAKIVEPIFPPGVRASSILTDTVTKQTSLNF